MTNNKLSSETFRARGLKSKNVPNSQMKWPSFDHQYNELHLHPPIFCLFSLQTQMKINGRMPTIENVILLMVLFKIRIILFCERQMQLS